MTRLFRQHDNFLRGSSRVVRVGAVLLARGTARFDVLLARGTARFDASSLRLIAVSVVLLLLAGTQAQSFALFRCMFTGVALTSCCCHGAEDARDSSTALLSKAGCCSIEHVDASLPIGAASPDQVAPPSQVLVALLPAPRVPSSVPIAYALHTAGMSRYAERTRAGPKTPLTIVHRRLLL